MLSVCTRHSAKCPENDDASAVAIPNWIDGTLPGRTGRFRVSAKTTSWEKAELIARKYEHAAMGREDVKAANTVPSVKEAVADLGDAEARGLALATMSSSAGSVLTLTAFYPSSVFVEERPVEMSEYAMAKAAGEVLCANLGRFSKLLRVVSRRLPRMLTDQTATVMPLKNADPLDVMLPVVRRVEGSTIQ